MRDRGHFQNSNFLATLHQKNTAIVIRIYTIAHIQSLSSFGPDLVEIFEVAERWVVVDVWVSVSIRRVLNRTCNQGSSTWQSANSSTTSIPIEVGSHLLGHLKSK